MVGESDEAAHSDDDAIVEVSSEDPKVGAQFATLTAQLQGADTVGAVLARILEATVAMLPGADLASITLVTPEGRFHTPAETDPLASDLDQLQYRFKEGPCHDVAEYSGPAVAECADLRVEPPWPRWARAAVERGMIAVLATALIPVPGQTGFAAGALNAYSSTPNALDQADQDMLLLLATHASLAVAGTEAVTREQLQETMLQRAIESRDVIGQAKGIIMAHRGVSADQAFDILRRASQDLNVKLVDLARTLTTRHSELDRL
jgi:GAF domain-containing protein